MSLRASHPMQRIEFFAEGRMDSDGWHGAPIGSASTLAHLKHHHHAFETDSLVLCGHALTDIDLTDMMQTHRQSGAEVTIAATKISQRNLAKQHILHINRTGRVLAFQDRQPPTRAVNTVANTGIYIFHPKALTDLPHHDGKDIVTHLLPTILARGGLVQAYTKPFEWLAMECPRDYVQAHFNALSGQLATLSPPASIKPRRVKQDQDTHNHQWLAAGAKISRRAQINGPCYIGPDTTIGAGVTINGPCVIGAGCQIDSGCLISDSMILPNTWVRSGAWVNGQLLGPEWALPYASADGQHNLCAPHPLDRTGPLIRPDHNPTLPQIAGSGV